MRLQKNMEENIFKIPGEITDKVFDISTEPEKEKNEKIEKKKNSKKILFIKVITTVILLGLLAPFIFRLGTFENRRVFKDLVSYTISSSSSFLYKLKNSVLNRKSNNSSGQNTIPGGSESAFSTLLNVNDTEHKTDGARISEDYKVDFSELDMAFKKEINSFLSSGNFWPDGADKWYWQTSWICGRVLDINDSDITIATIVPDGKGVLKAQYNCERNKTILMGAQNLNVLATNINFYREVRLGSLIYTHCLNEECTKLGNGCISMRTK